MATVIFNGFEGVNKVALSKGFKTIFNIGLKEATEFTNELLKNGNLKFENMTEEQVQLLVCLGDKANTKVDIFFN